MEQAIIRTEEALPVVGLLDSLHAQSIHKTGSEDGGDHGGGGTRSSSLVTVSLEPRPKDMDDAAAETCGTRFCDAMRRHQIPIVLLAAAVGVGGGIGLAMWNPADPATKDAVLIWVELVGDLFLRGLRCMVLPLIFVSIASAVMDMLKLGEAGSVAGTTVGLYLLTTLAAAVIGVCMSVAFSGFYTLRDGRAEVVPPDVLLGCAAGGDGAVASYLTEMDDGSVACVPGDGSGAASTFRVDDVNGYFALSAKARGPAELTVSESLRDGLFNELVPNNFVGAFTDANFLGVIVLATAIAVALVKLEKNTPDDVKWTRILTIQIIQELVHVFMMIIDWIIFLTPFAVASLIAGAIGEQSDLGEVFTQLGWLVTATVVGLVTQFSVVYCGLYTGFIRSNPFKYYAQMIPAYATAFGGASSAAAIPQSLACIKRTGQVPDGVASFVISLGATVNLDGSCIYIVCGAAWMAYQNGIVPTAGNYVSLVFSATFGSIAAAPVPSASLVLMLSAYSAAFGLTEGTPEGFAYILAIDWLVDRLRTVFNVTGDHTITAIVGDIVNKKEANKAKSLKDEDHVIDIELQGDEYGADADENIA